MKVVAIVVTSLLRWYQHLVPKILDKSHTLTAVRKVHRIYGRWNFVKIDIRIMSSEDLWQGSTCIHHWYHMQYIYLVTQSWRLWQPHSWGRFPDDHLVSQMHILLWIYEIVIKCLFGSIKNERHLWNPRPSIRTTIHVLGSSKSGCSKALTYSYLPNVSRWSLQSGTIELLWVRHISIYDSYSRGKKWVRQCWRVQRGPLEAREIGRLEAKSYLIYSITHWAADWIKHKN